MDSRIQSSDGASHDVGTLWTMRRLGHRARCALIDRAGDWELRVLADGEVLLTQRCGRGSEAFALAETWKRRMLAQGWHLVVPALTAPPASEASR